MRNNKKFSKALLVFKDKLNVQQQRGGSSDSRMGRKGSRSVLYLTLGSAQCNVFVKREMLLWDVWGVGDHCLSAVHTRALNPVLDVMV